MAWEPHEQKMVENIAGSVAGLAMKIDDLARSQIEHGERTLSIEQALNGFHGVGGLLKAVELQSDQIKLLMAEKHEREGMKKVWAAMWTLAGSTVVLLVQYVLNLAIK